MSAVALEPFMCYQHPNGLYSVVKHPSILCGGEEHAKMAVTGLLLVAFAAGYVAVCVVASVKMPSWSQNRIGMAQTFRFLTAKCRLNAWYFAIFVPVRGLLFSLAIAFNSDVPQAQVALGSVILMVYGTLQMLKWPWKVQAINLVDMCSNSLLLLLLGTGLPEGPAGQFDRTFSQVILGCFILIFGVCWVSIATASLHGYFRRGRGQVWLNFGRGDDPARVSQAMTECAEELLKVQGRDLEGRLRALNHYDLELIASTITLVSVEVAPSERSSRFRSRVVLSSLNKRLSLVAPSRNEYCGDTESFEPLKLSPARESESSNDEGSVDMDASVPEEVLGHAGEGARVL